MLKRLKQRIRREAFNPGYIGIFTNPFFIIRRGLWRAVSSKAPEIHGTVLDFGCGSKPYERLFVNASTYIGVDLADTGHDHTQSTIDTYYDGKSLPFPDEHFDAVIAFEVFEHVFNLEEILNEVHRVLKPGGTLFFTIPFAWDEHEIPYDFARYTSFGIASLIENASLDIDSIKKTTTYLEAVSQMFIAYVYYHVLPKDPKAKRVVQSIVIPPLLLFSLALNRVLPKNEGYYSNLAVVARKP